MRSRVLVLRAIHMIDRIRQINDSAKSLATPAQAGAHGRDGSRPSCSVPEDWREGARLWQAVEMVQQRLMREAAFWRRPQTALN